MANGLLAAPGLTSQSGLLGNGQSQARVSPWRVFSRVLFNGDSPADAYDREKMRPLLQRQKELDLEREEAQFGLLNQVLGSFAPQAQQQAPQQQMPPMGMSEADLGTLSSRGLGPGIQMASGGTGTLPPPPPQQGGLPSLQQLAGPLAALRLTGFEGAGSIADILAKAQPNIQVANGVAYDPRTTAPGTRIGSNLTNVNGFLVDQYDPSNAGRYLPNLSEGQSPLYDQFGNVVATRNLDGSVQAVAEREGAISGARERASAPYNFVNIPNAQTGAVDTLSKSAAAGGSFPGIDPADAARRLATANQDVQYGGELRGQADAARSSLSRYDQMEKLLPDIISGFGAEGRLNANRALALTGNRDAQRKVAATETYLNEARGLVLSIIRSFGANPSNAEREYADKMAGANFELNENTLAEGIRLGKARAQQQIQRYSSQNRSGGTGTPPPPASGGFTRAQIEAELRRRGRLP